MLRRPGLGLLFVAALVARADGFGSPKLTTIAKFSDSTEGRLAARRRAVVTALPVLVPSFTLRKTPLAGTETNVRVKDRLQIGYRAVAVDIGGQKVPVAQWYPLAVDQASRERTAAADKSEPVQEPYAYRIGIANLFKAFLVVRLPIPSPEVRCGSDHAVRVDAAPAATNKGGAGLGPDDRFRAESRQLSRRFLLILCCCGPGIVFAHGMLGSRFDMATLCEALAREGFVVSSADFAESISASFTPNPETTRGAIIDAEMALMHRDFGSETFGIFGHSAGGGSATIMPVMAHKKILLCSWNRSCCSLRNS